MSTIKKLIFKGPNRIVWLRYVTGVNLAQHCMKCLKGTNDKRFSMFADVREYENVVLEKAPYYYLCAVNNNFIYAKNVHVAWEDDEKNSFIYEDANVYIEVEGAKQIGITNRYVNRTLPHADEASYNTCRNWWFANWLNKQKNEL